MKERYVISGVQLGLLVALQKKEERQKVVDEIIDKQFIASTPLEKLWDNPEDDCWDSEKDKTQVR